MSQRDEIARIGLLDCITETDSVFPEHWDYEQCRASAERIADALAAAGLLVPPEPDDDFELPDDLDMVKPFVQMKRERDEARRRAVPPGLTAENLRRAALMVENGTYRREIADRLTSWASFLDTQETPR